MNLLQNFAGVLFVVCLLGFIGVYSIILANAAKHVGTKMFYLFTYSIFHSIGLKNAESILPDTPVSRLMY